jgi:tRNA(fMet)-specific endonuclease VapC
MKFLLDTNICIALMNGNEIELRRRVRFHPVCDLGICSLVVEELFYGALKSSRPEENQNRVESFIDFYQCLPFDEQAAKKHAFLRLNLKKTGKPVGHNDLMIASIAASHQLTLVTRNTREFSQVQGLQLEQW